MRLPAEHKNHVRCYHLVTDQTSEGRKFRTFNIIDVHAHQPLACNVAVRIRASDVLDILTEPVTEHGTL